MLGYLSLKYRCSGSKFHCLLGIRNRLKYLQRFILGTGSKLHQWKPLKKKSCKTKGSSPQPLEPDARILTTELLLPATLAWCFWTYKCNNSIINFCQKDMEGIAWYACSPNKYACRYNKIQKTTIQFRNKLLYI